MFSQCATISESLPAKTTSIRSKKYFNKFTVANTIKCHSPLACMNTYMDLLGTSGSKRFSALAAWKLIGFCVRVTMIHQTSAIRKLIIAHFTDNALIAMRDHVSLQSCLVVESLAAFGARMGFSTRMLPRVLYQRSLVSALFAAKLAGTFVEFLKHKILFRKIDFLEICKTYARMHCAQVQFNLSIVQERLSTELTLERLEASVFLGMSQQI